MSHYIGKTISLISNKQLRYVGVLDKISAEDATIALKSVRSFGTEGRLAELGQGSLEVPAGSDVYEYVVFRGSDVKDLTVLDVPLDQVQPSPVPQQAPQAPVQTQAPQAPAAAPAAAPAPTTTEASAPPATTTSTSDAPQPGAVPQPSTEKPRTTPSGPTPGSRPSKKPQFDGEFDFESANAKFVKETEGEAEGNTYSKSSFFDTLSSSNEERGNMRWSEEKQLNYDTFGQTSVHRGRGRGRGRGGFRGRGGRGRGRGRGKPEPKPEWA